MVKKVNYFLIYSLASKIMKIGVPLLNFDLESNDSLNLRSSVRVFLLVNANFFSNTGITFLFSLLPNISLTVFKALGKINHVIINIIICCHLRCCLLVFFILKKLRVTSLCLMI